MNNSTLSGNFATGGGGIFNYGSGTLTISNSTISGNSVTDRGGGINNGVTITISNSTISGNSAAFSGGGIFSTGTLTIGNSIVSGNTSSRNREIEQLEADTFISQGYNLLGHSGNNGFIGVTAVGTDITPAAAFSTLLAPLGNYGGSTQTHALLPGSAAINTGNAASTTLDQRGKSRVGTADIGAFESQGFTLAAADRTPQNITVGKTSTTPLTVTVKANNPIEPVAGGIVNITFTAPNSTSTATLSTNKVTIDASSNASTIATANTKPGTYIVKASATGMTGTADFTLTNIADVPTQIIPTNANQTAIVNKPFNTALQVQVLDQYGNPITNNAVTLTLPSNGASGLFAGGVNSIVLTTDANGLVTIPLTANNTPGTYTGTIAVTGISQTSQFTFTNEGSLVPIDRTRNLENRNPEQPIVVPSNGKAILCVERTNGTESDNDAYQGVATCGSSSAQSKPNVGKKSSVKPLVEPIVEAR
jgi:predicted outer membrane repeat protein